MLSSCATCFCGENWVIQRCWSVLVRTVYKVVHHTTCSHKGGTLKRCARTCRITPHLSHMCAHPKQATSLKLGAEKEALAAGVEEAQSRVSQGLPPSEDAEREWWVVVGWCGWVIGLLGVRF